MLLITTTWLLPLVLLPWAGTRAARGLTVAATLPALTAAIVLPSGDTFTLDWLLLGLTVGIDATSKWLLFGGALVWLVTAFHLPDSGADTVRLRAFFLLAMAGNLLLLLAQDATTFYLGYAVMGLSAYGLVAHKRSVSVRHAGRHYLAWTVAGELLLFAALVVIVVDVPGYATGFTALAETARSDTAMLLLVIAFGIKLALFGLHGWIALAYPAAPTAGAAVLGGVMINAGLLGWLRLLPIGDAGYTGWGVLLVVVGLLTSFYGAALGLAQRRAKVVLAYSSMSQMGIVTSGVGLVLVAPEATDLLLVALVVYALHHGLVKAALFLTLSIHQRSPSARWTPLLLFLLALALAGAPLTSGALAKGTFKAAIPSDWAWVGTILLIGSVATTLLMARFLVLAWHSRRAHAPLGHGSAVSTLLLAVAAPALSLTMQPAAWDVFFLGSIAPVVIGALIAWPVLRQPQLLGGVEKTRIPPGDLFTLVTHWRGLGARRPTRRRRMLPSLSPVNWPDSAESALRRWPVAGVSWLLITLLLIGALSL